MKIKICGSSNTCYWFHKAWWEVLLTDSNQPERDKTFSGEPKTLLYFTMPIMHKLVPNSWKYWRSLKLAVWSQTGHEEYWRTLNSAVTPHNVLYRYKHFEHVYQGAFPPSCLRYLNKGVSLQIYKKYNLKCVSNEVAICTACIEGRRVGPRVLQHVLCHYVLRF